MKYSIISAVPFALLALAPAQVQAQVTVYTGIRTTTASAASASSTDYSGLVSRPQTSLLMITSNSYLNINDPPVASSQPAYDPTTLESPAPPETPVTSYGLSVPANEQALTDRNLTLSVTQKGNFLGLSIELSVANTICTSRRTWLNRDSRTDQASRLHSGKPCR